MDTPKALDKVQQHYSRTIGEHGATARAVGWRDQGSQELRFDKLCTVIEAAGGPVTINDLGCGYAAMFPYLKQRLGDRLGRYYGYDISPEMLAGAREVVGDDPAAELVLSPVATHDADYSIVSGTYNVKADATDDEWMVYVKGSLLSLAARSRHGVAFNLLTTYVDWREPHLHYGNPFHYFEFCREQIGRRVALLHDYPLYEWTMIVRKS